MPDELVFSLLTPLVKDKSGSLTDPSNYRATALSTTLSKVLELILFERLQLFLHTSSMLNLDLRLITLQLMQLLSSRKQLLCILDKRAQYMHAF